VSTATASVTLAPTIYIDAVNGSDTAPSDGTFAHPYRTVAKAGSVAKSGQTIYAAAGSYSLQLAAVNLASNVGVEALSAGTVTFAAMSGNSYGLTFAGSGFVHGLKMDHSYVNASAGTVNLDGVAFTGISDSGSTSSSGINVTGTGAVIVTPGALTSYIDGTVGSFGYLGGAGRLEIHGGALVGAPANAAGSALIRADATSQLLLDAVTFDDCQTSALLIVGSPQITLQNGTLIHNCAGTGSSAWSLNVNSGAPTIVIDSSTITASPQAGLYVNGGATPSLTLQNGAVIEKSANQGILFQGSAFSTSTLTFNNARISQNGSDGVLLGGQPYAITVRGTEITGNAGDGFVATLSTGSTIDFGSAASAGGNTLSGNAVGAATKSNLNLSASGTVAGTAVGNTWDPNVQTTDSLGNFPSPTPSLTFTAPVTGKNVQLSAGGSSLSLVVVP
jgi:hypothetical protein